MFKIILLVCLVFSSCYGVVPDDDTRSHPTLKQVKELRNTNPIGMNREAMQLFSKAIGVLLKDGYEVAAVQFNNNKTSVIVNVEVADDVPLIILDGTNFTIAIHQIDQTKNLGYIHDCLEDACIWNENDEHLYLLDCGEGVPNKYKENE